MVGSNPIWLEFLYEEIRVKTQKTGIYKLQKKILIIISSYYSFIWVLGQFNFVIIT